MKVSDPIIFGHAVRAFVGDDVFAGLGDVRPNDGLASLLSAHPEAQGAVDAAIAAGPDARMVDSDRGITNLHVPSRRDHRRVDAGADPRVRPDVERRTATSRTPSASSPTPATPRSTPRRSTHCREHGAFDPATMGTTPNVGLMAQKAEEYGSHDKTFEIAAAGAVRVVDAAGATLLEHDVDARRHLAHVPDQGRADPGLGRPRRRARPGDRRARRVLARRDPRRTTRELLKKVRPALDGAGHRRPADRDPAGRRGDALHARARPRAARTRSRSPATSCATTSPTCSRSSSWARARRCSRSCR